MNFNYLWVILWFAIPAFIVCGRASRKLNRKVILLLALGILILSLVFDNILVSVGIVAYDPSQILGLFVPIAPIEDFGYTIVGVILVPVLWHWLGGKKSTDE